MNIPNGTVVNPEDRRARVVDAAYYRYTLRGYEPGRDLEDWLWAEREVDAELLEGCICPSSARPRGS
jgi:hypothetical protein